MNVQNISIATNPQYLASTRDLDNVRAARLAKDNNAVNGSGTVTPYGRVVGGTVLARDANGKDHPCGLTEATAIVSTGNTIRVADARNFRVGDLVTVADISASYAALAASRAITAIDLDTGDITLAGATWSSVVGDILFKVNAYVPSGICDRTVSTVEYIDATEFINERTVPLRVGGDVRTDGSVVGANGDGLLRRALSGQVWPDPANGGALRTSDPALVGFRFVNV